MRIKKTTAISAFLFIALLMVAHGFEEQTGFKIDFVTITLLLILGIPLLRPFVDTIKAGNLEMQFRALQEEDQILVFLDGIARDRQWTFYAATREGESNLGEAFAILIKELERKNYEKLINRIETWLSSGDANLMWLASEVIGYRKIEDMKDELVEAYQKAGDASREWPPWALNCKWAHSRFDNFQSLNEFLNKTTNKVNQIWLLQAYTQMGISYPKTRETLREGLSMFLKRNDLDAEVKARAEKVLSSM